MSEAERDAALRSVLCCETFAGAARARALLAFLAERTWRDVPEEINEMTIALDHLGRDPSTFDPKTDSVARVEMSRSRKRLQTAFANELAGQLWRISLPSGRYAPVFERVIPLPSASSTSDQTSAGAQNTVRLRAPLPDAPHPASDSALEPATTQRVTVETPSLIQPIAASPAQAGRWRILVTLAMACVAIGIVASAIWHRMQQTSGVVNAGDAVAVLPFRCGLSADEQTFCDAFTDELLDRLLKVPEIKVIARASSEKAKKKASDLAGVGQLLRANYLIDGAIQRDGEHYKLTAQLIRASDGTQLTSNVFTREGGNRFALQSDLANAVAQSLAPTMKPAFSQSRSDRESLPPELYAKFTTAGKQLLRGNPEDNRAAQVLLDEINAKAPSFAPAWNAKANAVYMGTYFGQSSEDVVPKAIEFQRKALQLAPDDPGIASRLMFFETIVNFDVQRVLPKLHALVERYPNRGDVLYILGNALWWSGDLKGAADVYPKAHALSPMMVGPLHMEARMWHALGGQENLEKALAVINRAIQDEPTFSDLYRVRSLIFMDMGHFPSARADFATYRKLMGPPLGIFDEFTLGALEKPPENIVARRKALADSLKDDGFSPAALSAARTGHFEEAIGWAQAAYARTPRAHRAALAQNFHNAYFSLIKNDPRMQAIYAGIGSTWTIAPK